MEEWRHLDDSWILESGVGPSQANNNAISSRSGSGSAATQEKKNLKKAKSNSKCRKRFSSGIDESAEEGVKKLDHNAKERIRRMKLNASYLALRALLPDSTRSKKKWSAPAIVDRVVKYIPELEKEIEILRSNVNAKEMNASVCMSQVNQQEAIFQVCVARQHQQHSQLTHLLQRLEDEGICINSASALDISHTRICHHLHIQTNDTASEAGNRFEELRDKVISWLR
ncbi:transcription factor bHLH160 isoform X2 [Salvia miltiorrhiza]|uniref:transcription factor bHLH160 isoform X2 n=1 Tax=Salvia miltiorrhiza TaxID=226208 RepID=UPI0025AD1613|nr:transcription factor bHLH160 isoform X2 [Salvia miltiorrhiza]